MNKSTLKQNYIIPVIGVIIVAFIGFSVIQQNSKSITTNTGENSSTNSITTVSNLQFNKNNFDFGEIPIYGGKVSTKFVMTNPGSAPMIITKITTSCMCTQAMIDDHSFGLHMNSRAEITLNPHESKEITVTFDPLAHGDQGTGPIKRIVSIETNSTSIQAYELKISGTVTKP